jgi:hypothetical protein
MKMAELGAELEAKGVDPRAYSIGRERDESWVVAPDRGHWTFYYSERGNKNSQRWFDSEVAVCGYALSEVLNGVFFAPRSVPEDAGVDDIGDL